IGSPVVRERRWAWRGNDTWWRPSRCGGRERGQQRTALRSQWDWRASFLHSASGLSFTSPGPLPPAPLGSPATPVPPGVPLGLCAHPRSWSGRLLLVGALESLIELAFFPSLRPAHSKGIIGRAWATARAVRRRR